MSMDRKRENIGELALGILQCYKVRKVGRNLPWKLREGNIGSQKKQVFEGKLNN